MLKAVDGKKDKFGIHAGPPLRRLIDERAGGPRSVSGVVNAAADRYLEMVRRAAPAWDAARWAWALALLRAPDALGRASPLDRLWDDVSAERWENARAAARALAGGAADGVERPAFTAALQRLSYVETVALVDVAERFWPRRDPAIPLRDALAALGVEVEP